jgi:5-methylcytosine-specific restriction endonuclease McrA
MMQRACLGHQGYRCGRLIPANRNRCPKCQAAKYREKVAARPPGVTNLYGSYAWQRLRDAVISEADRCHWCGARGVPLTADHVRRLRDHPQLGLDPANVVAACRSCQRRRAASPLR